MKHPLTRSQKKWISYLQAEQDRQRGSLGEHSRWPEFRLNCAGCFTELKTSNVKAALNFIENDHRGHRMTMEVNTVPKMVEYDRQVVLDQLVDLGKCAVKNCAHDGVVVKQTRNTWLVIKNNVPDVEGALKRLLAVYNHKDMYDQCLGGALLRQWIQAIIHQDFRLIKHIKELDKDND